MLLDNENWDVSQTRCNTVINLANKHVSCNQEKTDNEDVRLSDRYINGFLYIFFDKLVIYFYLSSDNEEEIKDSDNEEIKDPDEEDQENRQPLYQDLVAEYVNI
jgi:hypothetical protein